MNEDPDPRNRWERFSPNYRGMNPTLAVVGLGAVFVVLAILMIAGRPNRSSRALPRVAIRVADWSAQSQGRPTAGAAWSTAVFLLAGGAVRQCYPATRQDRRNLADRWIA